MLARYTDNDMLVGPGRQEVAITIHVFVRYLHIRGWEINPPKFRGLVPLKFLGVQWSGAFQDITSKVKGKLLHLAPPTIKNK